MFTGITKDIGILKSKNEFAQGITMVISTKLPNLKIGASIAVNGVCLTITKKTKTSFSADVISETLRRTNLKNITQGDFLNLEPSLRLGDELGGHVVMGHVDSVGVVRSGADFTLIREKESRVMEIEIPKNIQPYIFEKGSIAINGVSLTVTHIQKNSFGVALIPFTLKKTNLGNIQKGDLVNVEIDLTNRYARRYVQSASPRTALIVSEFNKKISDRLTKGALKALKTHRIKSHQCDIFKVPGAFEIPLIAQKIIDSQKYQGVITLGCILKGETEHFRAICDGVTFGIQKISIENRVPIMFGVLMCNTLEQAIARSQQNPKYNKGYECALGLLKILKISSSKL